MKIINRHCRASWLILISLVGAMLSSCSQPSSGSNAKQYELKGKIVSFNKSQRQVMVMHEEVPGLMEAMTMPFTLKEESAFDVMRAGDMIQATLIVDDERTRLENPIITQAIEGAATNPPDEGAIEPEIGAPVPDVTLINQDGKPISLNQYRGRTLVSTFIYTRCPLPDYCTLMSNNFAEINRELDKAPDLRKQVHLLSITLDPAYDTPKVLRSYGAAHTENYGNEKFQTWEFLTGKPEEIKHLAAFFGLLYKQQNEEIVHSLRTAIIAPDGRLHKLYRGNEWKPAEVLTALRELHSQRQPS